jgi:DNA-binding CsgD family transcriptional regulator
MAMAGGIMGRLTPREQEIVALLMQGRKHGEIATALCIERSTLKTHLRHARDKAGARTTVELAARVAGEGNE